MRASRHIRKRGATLLEGMVASIVFFIGFAGAMQSMLLASRQNQTAVRMLRAGSIAREMRAGIIAQGRTRLVGLSGLLDTATRCQTDLDALAAPVVAALGTPCVIDIDAFEASPPSDDLKLTPGYPAEDTQRFRRVLVLDSTNPLVDNLALVVSWSEGFQRRYHVEMTSLLNSSANTGLESTF